MGTQRVSNKDVLEAINGLTAAITQMVAAPAPAAVEAPAVEAPVSAPTGESTIKVDQKYRAHMHNKVSDLVKGDKQPRIMYARRNGYGEVKLAYCLASNWTGLKDRGLIGALEVIEA